MVDTPSPFPPPPARAKSKKPLYAIIIIVLILLIGGFLFMKSRSTSNQAAETVPTETPEPTPTEKPQVDRKTVKIQVQNGTGTPGQASSAVEALTKAGYEADNIKTGNAETYDNKTTTISAKEGFEATAEDIKSALESTFDTIKIDSSPLDSSGDFDIVIVTGGKIFSTTAPSPATTSVVTPTAEVSTTPAATSTPTPTP